MDKVADRWFCVWFALAAGEARRVSRAASPGPGDVAVSTFCEVRKRGLRRAANHPHQHRVRCPRRDRGLAGPQLRDADLKVLVHERYRRRFGATSGGFGRRARGPASVRTALEPGAPLSLPVVPQRAPEPMCSPPPSHRPAGLCRAPRRVRVAEHGGAPGFEEARIWSRRWAPSRLGGSRAIRNRDSIAPSTSLFCK